MAYQAGVWEYQRIKMEEIVCVRKATGPLSNLGDHRLGVTLMAKLSAGLTMQRAGKFILCRMVTEILGFSAVFAT
jgi:hypothetical protein